MSSGRSEHGDFGPHVADFARCVTDVLGHVQETVRKVSRGEGPGMRGGPWEWGPGRHKSSRPWPGGFGAWGQWWPGPMGPMGPPGPRGHMHRQKASRGDVRAAILALLQEGPRTGYQIMSEIEELSGGAWRPSPGAVYPALQQLADEGLIVGEESGGKRTFSLTQAGRSYVEENPEMARGAWERAAEQQPSEVPGLFAQAARLGASIVQMAHAGTPEQVRAAERLLEQTQHRLYQILAEDSDDEQDGE
jgi:DNA-binding PadR family transcriptional regulator